jgi:hypothetical protein
MNKARPHDKVPASAPVHTDAEAGGRGTPRSTAAGATREQSDSRAPEQVPLDYTNPGRGQFQIPERRLAWLMALGLALLIVLGLTVAVVTLP